MIVEAGTRLAVIGENGVGKTTFLRCLIGELTANSGTIKWAVNATLGYCPQDSNAEFDCDLNLFDWMSQWRKPVTTIRPCVPHWDVYCFLLMILKSKLQKKIGSSG